MIGQGEASAEVYSRRYSHFPFTPLGAYLGEGAIRRRASTPELAPTGRADAAEVASSVTCVLLPARQSLSVPPLC